MSTTSRVLSTAANWALLFVYGGVFLFFAVGRYRANRAKRPNRERGHHRISLGIGLMSIGWMWLALLDLGLVKPLPFGIVRWCGVGVGVFLLWATRPNGKGGRP